MFTVTGFEHETKTYGMRFVSSLKMMDDDVDRV